MSRPAACGAWGPVAYVESKANQLKELGPSTGAKRLSKAKLEGQTPTTASAFWPYIPTTSQGKQARMQLISGGPNSRLTPMHLTLYWCTSTHQYRASPDLLHTGQVHQGPRENSFLPTNNSYYKVSTLQDVMWVAPATAEQHAERPTARDGGHHNMTSHHIYGHRPAPWSHKRKDAQPHQASRLLTAFAGAFQAQGFGPCHALAPNRSGQTN